MIDLQALSRPPADFDPDAIELPALHIGPALADWNQQRQEVSRLWLEYLGQGPEQVPLDAEIHGGEDLGEVTRTLVSYQVEDGCRVEAYLMAPKDDGSFPGIVVFHPTTDTTIDQPAGLGTREPLQFALNLALRGYVTITPRNFIWNYRGKLAGEWTQYIEITELLLRTWPEWTGMGKMVWDGLRAVDYLLTIPAVDGSRLGCIGHSLGAKEALYAMAFDERLNAGISCEGGVGLPFTNWDAPWYLGEQIHKRQDLEHHQLVALAAPGALLVIGGGAEPSNRPEATSPGADRLETWNYLEAARPAYELYDAAQNLGYLLHDQGHGLPEEHEGLVYEWFGHFLPDKAS